MDLRKAAAVLTVAMIAMPAWADGNGKGKQGHGQAQVLEQLQLQTSQLTLTGYITAGERQTILSYFQQHQAAYAGVKPLPPGIAKKVARGGAMPPGIAK